MKNILTYCARTSVLVAFLASLSAHIYAGGLVELDGVFGGNSNLITNPWWPLPEGETMTYFADDGDECVVDIVEVLATAKMVNGVDVREVSDTEYLDEDCDGVAMNS